MATQKMFERKDQPCHTLSLVISILALSLSAFVVIKNELRYTDLTSKFEMLDRKSQDCVIRLENLKLKSNGQRTRRDAPQGGRIGPLDPAMRQNIDKEIKRQVQFVMNNLHKVYCVENETLVIVGAKGEPGSSGLKGSIGKMGPKGEKGIPGPLSEKGQKGDSGTSVSAPTITNPPKAMTVNLGDTVIFSCTAEGLPRPSITWFRISGALPSGNHVIYSNGSLLISSVRKGNEGIYACLAKNVLGQAKSFVSFNIILPVEFIQRPKNLYVTTGSTAEIYCKAQGFPQPVITWYKGNQTNRGKKLDTQDYRITFVKAESQDSGVYTCVAQNIINKLQAKAEFVVVENIKFTVRPPKRSQHHVGQTSFFNCQGQSGKIAQKISWTRKDGRLINKHHILSNGTLVLFITSKSDAGEYLCVASNPLASANVTLVVDVYVRSCSEWRMAGATRSGDYTINPDGPGGNAEFKVYCDMQYKNGTGVTVFSHDSEMRTAVQGFPYPGSYLRNVNYTSASKEQIISLIEVSENCEQFIKYECLNSVLLWHGLAYGWWVSRDGEKMDYWGGATPGSWMCACAKTSSCQGDHGCNCDANDGEWREDSGLLVDKTTLPVSQLRFGDTGIPLKEKGFHTLGKLKCYGI